MKSVKNSFSLFSRGFHSTLPVFRRANVEDPREARKQIHSLLKTPSAALNHWIKDTPSFRSTKVNQNALKPKQMKIIVLRDHKFGIKGETTWQMRPLANQWISQGKAIECTRENYEKYVGSLSEEDKNLILERRMRLNRKAILQRTVLYFRRTVRGHRSLVIPITRWQICKKLWQITKLPISPETIIDWKEDIKVPGRYEVKMDIGDDVKMVFRVHVTEGPTLDG